MELIYTDNPGSVPASYTLPPNLSFTLQSVSASIDGSAAAGDFLPCFAVYSQDGHLIGRYPVGTTFFTGDSGEVTWSPFLGGGGQIINNTTPGFTLDYAEAPSGIFNVTGTSEATANLWIQGNPVTFDGNTTAQIMVWAALGRTDRDLVLELFMDNVDQGRIGQLSPASYFYSGSFIGIGHVIPAAGTHTFDIRAWKTNAFATADLTNPAPFPAVAFQPSFYEITVSTPLT